VEWVFGACRGDPVRSFGSMLLLAGVLTIAIAFELLNTSVDDRARPESGMPAELPLTPATVLASVPRATSMELVEFILARPLFSPDRRPTSSSAAVAAPQPPLPRLTGVVVFSSEQRAIFAPSGNGKSVVVAEGERIGDVLVRRIEAGRVTVLTPDGERVLRPTFDPSLPVRSQSSAVPLGPVNPGQIFNLPIARVLGTPPFPISERLPSATRTPPVSDRER
jgi:hypothetical protein